MRSAALESTAFGLSISDALTRSNHFLGVTAIVLASIALGRAAARRPRYQALAGLLAPWLVCLPNMFASVLSYDDSSVRHPFASYLPDLIGQEIKLRCYEGFLGLGWSDLWGSIVSITVASLLSAGTSMRSMSAPSRRLLPALLVAVLGIPVNGLAAMVCVLVVVASGVLLRPGWKSLAFAVLGIAFFWLFRRAADLHQASIGTNALDAGGMLFRAARTASVAFTVLFGLRGLCVMNLVWGSRETRLAMCLFVCAFLGLGLVFALHSSYPVLFPMFLLSAYAAAPLAVLLQSWRSGPAAFAAAMGACGRTYRSYLFWLLIVLSLFLPICWFPFLRHFTRDSIYGVSALLAIAVPSCGLVYGLIARAMCRGWTLGRAPAAVVFLLSLALSIGGFVRLQLGWNWDWYGSSVQVDAPRVQSLTFVRDHVPPGALLATTHHFVDVGTVPERSYVYAALAHRYCFVEGWAYSDPTAAAEVEAMRHDNDLLFQTRDADVAEKLVRKYGVTHLLVEPDATLGFDATKVAWLRPLANPGSLTVYEVVPPAAAR